MDRNKKTVGIVMILLAVLLAVAALVWGGTSKQGGAKNTGTVFVGTCSTDNKVDAVKAVMVAQGFNTDEFVVGEKNFVLTAESTEVGSGAFTDKAKVTAKAHMAFLNSGTPQAKAVIAFHAKKTGATKAQVLDTRNWYNVQIKVNSTLAGNTVYQNGKVVAAGTRQSSAGDIVWVFIPPKACANGVVNIKLISYQRAGCENPQHNPPKPDRPTSTPTPTPTPCVKPPVPGPGNYEYNPTTCTWHKKSTSWECQQNGGPGCPPNQATQPPQHNPGQPTGPSGPSTEPSPAPSWTDSSTPPPNGGGYDGGSHAPGPTPSNSPEVDPTATPTGYATGMPA